MTAEMALAQKSAIDQERLQVEGRTHRQPKVRSTAEARVVGHADKGDVPRAVHAPKRRSAPGEVFGLRFMTTIKTILR
jgi:hypothetical protein